MVMFTSDCYVFADTGVECQERNNMPGGFTDIAVSPEFYAYLKSSPGFWSYTSYTSASLNLMFLLLLCFMYDSYSNRKSFILFSVSHTRVLSVDLQNKRFKGLVGKISCYSV